MQAWYERGGPEGGRPRGEVEEYMHKVMEMGHGVNAEGCRAITHTQWSVKEVQTWEVNKTHLRSNQK